MKVFGLIRINNEYATKQQEGVSTEKLMMGLYSREYKDLNDINERGRKIIQECDIIKQKLEDSSYDRISNNFAKTISMLCDLAHTFTKRVTKYKHVAATHVLVLMISPELHTSRLYSLPV